MRRPPRLAVAFALWCALVSRARGVRPAEEAPTPEAMDDAAVGAEVTKGGEPESEADMATDIIEGRVPVAGTDPETVKRHGACAKYLASAGTWTPVFDYRKVGHGILAFTHQGDEAIKNSEGIAKTAVPPELDFHPGESLAMWMGIDVRLNYTGAGSSAKAVNSNNKLSSKNCPVDNNMIRLSMTQECEEDPKPTEVQVLTPQEASYQSFRLRLPLELQLLKSHAKDSSADPPLEAGTADTELERPGKTADASAEVKGADPWSSGFETLPVNLQFFFCVRPSENRRFRPLHFLWFFLNADEAAFPPLYADKAKRFDLKMWTFKGYQKTYLNLEDPKTPPFYQAFAQARISNAYMANEDWNAATHQVSRGIIRLAAPLLSLLFAARTTVSG